MTVYARSLTTPEVKTITDELIYQLFRVMGLQQRNLLTRGLYPVFYLPVNRLAKLVVGLDQDISQMGLISALGSFLENFVAGVIVQGEENIPSSGPLLVVANHPAAYDIFVLINAIKRSDIKVLHSDIPLLQMLPNIAECGIPVPYDITRRINTVRSTIQHLKNDGSIFIFPRGNVEPDPSVSPGAEASLEGWSSSLELFLRSVPQTKTVIAIASGMLSAKWYNNPFINRWKKYEQRQKVAEIFQITAQFLVNKKPTAIPKVNFSCPLTLEDLGGQNAPDGNILSSITGHARLLLDDHLNKRAHGDISYSSIKE